VGGGGQADRPGSDDDDGVLHGALLIGSDID